MKKKILITDKDKGFISELTDILEKYSVVHASNRKEVLQTLRTENHIDLIITNLALRNIDGLTIISKARDKFPEIKTILISTGNFTKKEISMLGVDYYFRIVFNPLELLKTVKKLLKK